MVFESMSMRYETLVARFWLRVRGVPQSSCRRQSRDKRQELWGREWLWHGSRMSNIKDVCCKPRLYVTPRMVNLLAQEQLTVMLCHKNKKVAHRAILDTDIFTYNLLMSSVIIYWTDTLQHGIYHCAHPEKNPPPPPSTQKGMEFPREWGVL